MKPHLKKEAMSRPQAESKSEIFFRL